MIQSTEQEQRGWLQLRMTWRELLFAAVALAAVMMWIGLGIDESPRTTTFIASHDAAVDIGSIIETTPINCQLGKPEFEKGQGSTNRWAVWQVPIQFENQTYDARLLNQYRGVVSQALTDHGVKRTGSGQATSNNELWGFSIGYAAGDIQGHFSASAVDQGDGKFTIICFASEELDLPWW